MSKVSVESTNQICLIRFTNPQKRNPLSVAVLSELEQILAEHLSQSKAVIFTGSADVFASGADLREIAALAAESDVRAFGLRAQSIMHQIATAPCLTIAAINGYCFGGAFDLALSCKKRIASPNALFSHPGAKLGIMTGWSGTQRLPRVVGEAAALEIFLTAKQVDAHEALRINLVDQISENALDAAFQLAECK